MKIIVTIESVTVTQTTVRESEMRVLQTGSVWSPTLAPPSCYLGLSSSLNLLGTVRSIDEKVVTSILIHDIVYIILGSQREVHQMWQMGTCQHRQRGTVI